MKLALAALVLSASTIASADSVVTACQRDTQQGAGVNLAAALAQGGVIRFACPRGGILFVTMSHRLSSPTRIEGSGIILDGAGYRGVLFDVAGKNNLILTDITVQRMRVLASNFPRVQWGSVVRSAGPVELSDVRILRNETPLAVTGRLSINASSFEGNDGNAVIAREGYISRSTFQANGSALSISSGELIDNKFRQHTRSSVVVSTNDLPLMIRGNRFINNRGGSALRLPIRGKSRVDVRANIFEDNDGGNAGGGVGFYDIAADARAFGQSPRIVEALERLPMATIAFAYNRFIRNAGDASGAISANLSTTSTVSSIGDQFVGNHSRIGGGAIGLTAGRFQISNALFADNRANGRGSAILVTGGGELYIANSLVVRNDGGDGAVAIHNATLRMQHVTVAANKGVGVILTGSASVTSLIEQSIFSKNEMGDCSGMGPRVFDGPNLQSPSGSCTGVTQAEAFLDSRFVPLPGSPAYGAGEGKRCQVNPVRGRDIFFQSRGLATCTLGAFEGPLLDKNFLNRLDKSFGAMPTDAPVLPIVDIVPRGEASNNAQLQMRLRTALEADYASPSIFMEMRVEVGQTADIFVVERVRPDKWRIARNPARQRFEYLSIGSKAWMRAGAQEWVLAAPISESVIFPFQFTNLADQVTDLAEVAGEPMMLVGKISWVNGATVTVGRVALVFAQEGKLAELRFDGMCGSQNCRIMQTIKRPVGADIIPP